MPPAARITDMHVCPLVTPGTPPVPHVGGPVVAGAPTVIVAGMPQARVGDTCTCVGPPDAIAMGSPTVLICGMPAARLGDPTIHGGTVVSGAPNVLIGVAGAGGAAGGSPATVGPVQVGEATSGDGPPPVAPPPGREFKHRLGGDDNIDVMYVEGSGNFHSDDDRTSVEGKLGIGMARMDHTGHIAGPLGGSHKLDVLTAEASFYGGETRYGRGMEAKAGASMVSEEASLFGGPDENNPFGEVAGGYKLMTAEARGDYLLGSDGRRAGVSLGGGAEAKAASGDIRGETNIPIPLTGWTISLRGKASGSAGSLGASAGGYGYKDLETERYHVGAFGKLAAGLGLGGDVDISIGPPYSSRDRRH